MSCCDECTNSFNLCVKKITYEHLHFIHDLTIRYAVELTHNVFAFALNAWKNTNNVCAVFTNAHKN